MAKKKLKKAPSVKKIKTVKKVKKPSDENMWAVVCHLSSFLGLVVPLGNVIGPLVVWLLKRGEFESVNYNGRESLNFQISLVIYATASAILIFILIGIPLLVAVLIFGFVLPIVAAYKTSNGETYRYPLTIRFIK